MAEGETISIRNPSEDKNATEDAKETSPSDQPLQDQIARLLQSLLAALGREEQLLKTFAAHESPEDPLMQPG